MTPPDKRPTDAQVVKGFGKWDQGWAAMLAAVRHNPDAGPDDEQTLWDARDIVRALAVEAQHRIDAKEQADG